MSSFEIVRDEWGIAHVRAPDRDTAFAAQGWIAASDRMWQMEYDRLRVLGRWAEVAGPGAVREDAFFRRMGLAAVAEADWEALSDATRSMTERYAEGVNRWLDENRDALPAELSFHPRPPEPWEPWHCVAVYKVRHVFMGTLYRKLWRGAVTRSTGPEVMLAMRGDPAAASAMVPGSGAAPDLLAAADEVLRAAAADLAAIGDAVDGEGGSNSWAVSGSRTASGAPLLAGDPHRGIEFPNVYHQCHVRCPDFDVVGLAFPGVPGFPHFGHNARVAWCITHGMADDTDVFVEPTAAVRGRRSEQIEVHGAEPVTVELGDTPSGPVALGDLDDAHVLAVRWTGAWGHDTTFACLEPMLTAGSCDELEAAVADWVIPVNNLLCADVAGSISFKIRGRVIERPPANRWTPVAGSPDSRWDGLEPVAHERLPAWRDPDRGFLVTANNRTSERGPYVSLDFAGPARHDRIVELLSGARDLDVSDMAAIHRDVRSLVAPAVCAAFGRARPATAAGTELLAGLGAWDGELRGDAGEPVGYWRLRHAWSAEVGDRLGISGAELGGPGWPRAFDASRMLLEGATRLLIGGGWRLVPGLGDEDDLARVLGALADDVAARHDASATWADVHVMASPHPLAAARGDAAALAVPVDGCPGDGDTVRAGALAPLTGTSCVSSSVARYVFDLDDWDRSGWVVPHGVSGVRGSGHDLDQRAAWLAGELLPMAYGDDAVARHAVETATITW